MSIILFNHNRRDQWRERTRGRVGGEGAQFLSFWEARAEGEFSKNSTPWAMLLNLSLDKNIINKYLRRKAEEPLVGTEGGCEKLKISRSGNPAFKR